MKKQLKSAWRSLRGKKANNTDEAGLFLEHPSSSKRQKISGLSIKPYGRMGNNLLQISNAILLARALNLRFVQLPQMSLLKVPEPVTIDGLTLLPSDHDLSGFEGIVNSTFFRETRLERVGSTMETRRRALQKYIVPNLATPSAPQGAENSLTIHLRSGDVFGPNPHPGYTQPPLSFYIRTIEDARDRHLITSVQLVFEDRKNPCIRPLEEYITTVGLSLATQSGSFHEDVSVLLSARNLVFGYGTFGLGICLLSNRCQSVYVFGTSGFPYSKLENLKHLAVFDDRSGTYPRAGEWKASQKQREQMVSLPPSAIAQIDETKPTRDALSQWWSHLDTQI